MLLTIDVGNSQIHAGLFNGDGIAFQFRYTTAEAHGSSDQLGIFLRQVVRENGFDPKAITGVAIASVVPAINYSLRAAVYKYLNLEPFFLQPGVKTGLKMKVATPKEVGADRIAGCIAAAEAFPDRNILVIDLGTATVFDIVTKDKEYLSGAILPGVKISVESLSANAAQLSSVSIVKPESAIGKDTDTNIQSGIYYGHLGAIKSLKEAMLSEINDDVLTVATGGFSQLFNQEGLFDVVISDLVLQGIKLAYHKNQTNQ
ncbi:type III pantothenate kinase [Fangia hongkongensis]|uniref:type III pantothenate kinase n=1 Tax=Fangia hongkongensis TaxID=270495 RepID=UPI00035C0FF2|nr:type III pantothenate kinase [Fangia hongkongensis]MBK2124642.1 type III pantothenate kinase [Fangia hongkongensis]